MSRHLQSALPVWVHLALRTTPWGKDCWYPNFPDWENWGTEKVSNSPKFHTASPGSEPRQASFRTHTVSWNKSPSLSYSDPEINQDRVGTHPHLTPVSRESLVSKDLKIHGTSLATQWLRLWASNVQGEGSVPGGGTKTLHAMWHGQSEKKKKGPKI